jgi:hypothetical protein
MSSRAPGDPRCKDCPEPHEPGRSRCEACAERHRMAAAERLADRKARKRCAVCGAPAAKRKRDGRRGTVCERHAAYYLARAR